MNVAGAPHGTDPRAEPGFLASKANISYRKVLRGEVSGLVC